MIYIVRENDFQVDGRTKLPRFVFRFESGARWCSLSFRWGGKVHKSAWIMDSGERRPLATMKSRSLLIVLSSPRKWVLTGLGADDVIFQAERDAYAKAFNQLVAKEAQ